MAKVRPSPSPSDTLTSPSPSPSFSLSPSPSLTLALTLTQNQFDALASACFNLGTGVLHVERSLGQALRGIGDLDVPQALALYDHAGGYRVNGLTLRRAAEATLWATPDSGGGNA